MVSYRPFAVARQFSIFSCLLIALQLPLCPLHCSKFCQVQSLVGLAMYVCSCADWCVFCSSGMDAITLDDDLCIRKGALTGGFIDLEKSRLRAHYALKEAEGVLRKLEGKHAKGK